MTLCIAIKAVDWEIQGEPHQALVLCADSLGSTDYSSTEYVSKLGSLPHGFVGMIAGPISTAREMLTIVHQQMQAPLRNIPVLVKRLRRSLRIQKSRFADEHVGAQLGISYSEFRKSGKSAFPDDLHRETAWEIRNHRSGIELLVCGFIDGVATIVKLTEDHVTVCEKYAAIGAGAFLAEADLMQRDYLDFAGVDYATYLAYEAKRLGERAPGVGRATGLVALLNGQSGVTMDIFNVEQLPLLERKFKRFGPQPLSADKLKRLPRDAWIRVNELDQEPTTVDQLSQRPWQE